MKRRISGIHVRARSQSGEKSNWSRHSGWIPTSVFILESPFARTSMGARGKGSAVFSLAPVLPRIRPDEELLAVVKGNDLLQEKLNSGQEWWIITCAQTFGRPEELEQAGKHFLFLSSFPNTEHLTWNWQRGELDVDPFLWNSSFWRTSNHKGKNNFN